MARRDKPSVRSPEIIPHQRFQADSVPAGESGGLRYRFGSAAIGVILGAAIALPYLANGRYVGSGDCVPAMYVPIALARGDGPWLDRFEPFLADSEGRLPGYAEKSRGHALSRYPIGPGLVLAPLVAPQVWWWDGVTPGWDRSAETLRLTARRMAKNASAVLGAASMVLLWFWLRSQFEPKAAIFGTLTAALGSGMWSTASQAPWQHGPAVFCLCMVLCLLKFGAEGLATGLAAGFFAAMIVVCRTVDLPIAAAMGLFVVRRKPHLRMGFLIASISVAALWSGWNVYFFDHWTGGYSEIEKMHGWAHGIEGSWSTPLAAGLAGTFFSPSHGLVVYSPWVLAVLAAPWALQRIDDPNDRRLMTILGLSLVPTTIILAKYGCWWAGHCFGPRFWIDSTPILSIFAAGLWAIQAKMPRLPRFAIRTGLMLGLAWAMGMQAIAVATYPTSWHSVPTNADRDHKRLWDFRDNEVTRGLMEGPHPREWPGWF